MAVTYNNRYSRYVMPDNYLYLYHVPNNKGTMGVCILLPAYADSVTDTQNVNFNSSTPLARSAPIFSYSSSGPRTLQVSFNLHRDMMKQINYGVSTAMIENNSNDDYTDLLIRYIQAAALPTYEVAKKMVNPPQVALRLGQDLFIKGVITGSVGVTYRYPILSDGKYALVDVAFGVTETEPYDALIAAQMGSSRGLNTSLARNLYVAAQPFSSYSNPR